MIHFLDLKRIVIIRRIINSLIDGQVKNLKKYKVTKLLLVNKIFKKYTTMTY